MYCSIFSSRTGYFVMRCVTNRMNSGTSLRLTRELLLCCCQKRRNVSVKHLQLRKGVLKVGGKLTLTKFWNFLFCCWSSLKTLTASMWWLQNSPYTCFIVSAFSSENWRRWQWRWWPLTSISDYHWLPTCHHQPAEEVRLQFDGWGNFGSCPFVLQPGGVPAALWRGFCGKVGEDPSRGRSGPRSPSRAAAPPAYLSWIPPTWLSEFEYGAALSASALHSETEHQELNV